MVKLTVLGSSSKGNSYLFEDSYSCIVVEAGVKLIEVKKALNFNVSKVCGCIVTHEHKDHSKYVGEYLKNGIKCYTSAGTIKALGIESMYLQGIAPLKTVNIGGWRILPFETKHDCSEPYGYLINNKECGTVLFATDTYYLPNTFKSLNHVLIECNYDKDILNRNNANESLKKRLLSSHMSIDTCINALKANDLSDVENIVLIHLSDNNSNAKEFKSRVERATGVPTKIAEVGMQVWLGGRINEQSNIVRKNG